MTRADFSSAHCHSEVGSVLEKIPVRFFSDRGEGAP